MRTVIGNTNLLAADDTILCDCTGGDITVTLPYGNSITYLQQFSIVKVDRTANIVKIVPQLGEAIDGGSQITLVKDPFYNAIFRLQALAYGWHNPASKTPIDTLDNNFNPAAVASIQKIAGDPNTVGWGESQEGTVWEDTITKKAKKWDGNKVVLLG